MCTFRQFQVHTHTLIRLHKFCKPDGLPQQRSPLKFPFHTVQHITSRHDKKSISPSQLWQRRMRRPPTAADNSLRRLAAANGAVCGQRDSGVGNASSAAMHPPHRQHMSTSKHFLLGQRVCPPSYTHRPPIRSRCCVDQQNQEMSQTF